MSRFRKLSQTIWHCQYHIVFVPKYRFRILIGEIAQETEHCMRAFVEQQKCEIVELNIQMDHVHLLVLVPPEGIDIEFCWNIEGPDSDQDIQ